MLAFCWVKYKCSLGSKMAVLVKIQSFVGYVLYLLCTLKVSQKCSNFYINNWNIFKKLEVLRM